MDNFHVRPGAHEEVWSLGDQSILPNSPDMGDQARDPFAFEVLIHFPNRYIFCRTNITAMSTFLKRSSPLA